MSATGFFQWRTSGGKHEKTNLPLLDFPYSKLPAADTSATAARLWRTVSKPSLYNRGNPGWHRQAMSADPEAVSMKQGPSTARSRTIHHYDGTSQNNRSELNGSGI